MECQICGVRSSDGFCIICQRLVCEECSHICYKCGKRACVEHGYMRKSGKWVCSNCLEQRKAKGAPAGAAAPAGLAAAPVKQAAAVPQGAGPVPPGVAPEEEIVFEEPEVATRREVDPWKLGLAVGIVSVLSAGAFAVMWNAIPWPLLLLTVLGIIWCGMGLMGRRKNKVLAGLGLALNIVPFVLAVVVGITGWEKKAPKEDLLDGLTQQQLIKLRQQKQQEILNELRKARGMEPQQIQQPLPSPPPPPPPSPSPPPAATSQ